MTYLELRGKIKGVFKLPKRKVYFGRIKYGTPYMYPINFCATVIKIRKLNPRTDKEIAEYKERWPYVRDYRYKNLPVVRRSYNKIIKLFGNSYYVEWGWPWSVRVGHLGWKDKFDSPRYEWAPYFQVNFLGLQFHISYLQPDYPVGSIDQYYEQILWYLHYSDGGVQEARETWLWVSGGTKESTWNDKYLIQR